MYVRGLICSLSGPNEQAADWYKSDTAWDSLGLQRAEIWYTCKNNRIPLEFSFKLSFYSPAKYFFSPLLFKDAFVVNYTWQRSNKDGVFWGVCGVRH